MIDWELLVLIFSKLERLELPRLLLLACECVVKSRAVALAVSQQQLNVLQCVKSAAGKIAELIVREVETNLGAGIQLDASACLSTLHRLVSVINTEGLYPDPTSFVQSFISLSHRCAGQGQKAAGDTFVKAATQITQHLTDPEAFSKASSVIPLKIEERHEYTKMSRIDASQKKYVCSEAIHKFESLFC